jgi:hypothetical protein
MTPRPTPQLQPLLLAAHARVRRALIGRHALRATAASLVVLAACVTAGLALPRDPGTAGARLFVFLLGSAVALVAATFALWRETPRWDAWLESLETRFPGLRSLLRNAIDLERVAPSTAHTSNELAGAVRDDAARRLAEAPLRETVPGLRARVPLVALAAATLSLVSASMLAPVQTRAAWSTLWNPASAAPPMTLVVDPGNVTVVPGAALAVRARVEGSAVAPRLVGDGPSPQPVLESTANGGHRWRFDLPPVTRPRDYAVRVAALASPTYHIALTGAPRAVSFSSAISSPAYARLPVQVVSGTRGDLSALTGSRAVVEATFDRDLESLSASVNGGQAVAWSALTPRRWRGTVALNGDGSWDLTARAATGEATSRYKLSVIPDAPPVLTVATPEGDLDLPAGQLVPYDAIIQDDLGVSELKLEWRKTASDPWKEESLARFGDEPREARAAARWDASPLALLPGESGVFRLVAYDNARPGARGRATSSEFRLRFPTLSDLYASIEDRQESVSKQLEKAAEQTREVQKSLEKLQRQPQAQGRQGPSFERTEEIKKTAERQQAVADQVNKAANDMRESLEQAAERQAFQEQLQKKLKEMSEILKDIQSQEFKDALKKMEEALQKMDRRAMEETLPQLQEQNKDMLQQIERSMELLKQLREEERLEALARRADDLKTRQDELNRQHGEQAENQKPQDGQKSGDPKADSKSDSKSPQSDPQSKSGEMSRDALTQQQKRAAEESRELAKDAHEASKSSEQQDSKQRLEEAAKELETQASEQQEEAGRDSEKGDSQSAQSSGQKASESLAKASNAMRQSAQQQQQEQDQRNLAAVRRASQDLVSLSRASQQNTDGQRPPSETADAQTDLAEGVARVADSLSTLSQQTPFLSNKVSAALGRAMQGLQQSGREMSQGGAQRGQMSGKAASASLNEAVKELRATEASMCQQPGAGTGGKTAAQRLGEVGKQQAQLNQQSRQIARKLSQQMSMTQGDAAEMRRLADEQRRIREQLDEVRRDDDAKKSLLGRLDEAQKQMDQVEESIRQGDVGDDTEEKQTQILSRLLDAQRSIHRRDFDPEREARRGEDVAHSSPALLAKDLFRENDRLRQDLLKADADRVPSQYRSLIEAYLRALNGSPK